MMKNCSRYSISKFCINTPRWFALLSTICIWICAIEAQEHPDSIADKNLNEIVVEHKTTRRTAQGDLITITKDMRVGARNTGELLGNIPGAFYNPIDRSLSFYGSSNMIVLVDSIERDFSYITRLNQNRFDKISITYNPTGKYKSYDAVINLKTRQHYQGYDGEIDLDATVYTGNRNGDGNALGAETTSAQFGYTYDKINVGGQVSNSWGKSGSTGYYERYYPLNGIRETTLLTPRNHPGTVSISRNTSANAFIDYRINDRHIVAASYFFRFNDSDADTDYRLLTENYNLGTTGITQMRSRSHTHNSFSHNGVLYYWGRVKGFNIHAYVNYTSNSKDTYSTTCRDDFVLTDNRHITTRKMWGGAQVSKQFLDNTLSVQASYFYNRNTHNQYALFGGARLSHNSDVNQFPEVNIYFNPSNSSWSASVSGGVTLYQNSADGNTYRNANPWGGLQVSFNPSNKLSMRLNYHSGDMQPTLSQIENYGVFTDSLEYCSGNPALKPGFMHMLSLYTTVARAISVKVWANLTPTDMRNIASTGYGMRPDGIVGPFVRYDWVNSRRSEWGVNVSFNHTFAQCFQTNVSAGFTRHYQRYKEMSNRRTYANGSLLLKYFNQQKMAVACLMYNISANSGLSPQAINYGYNDNLALILGKEFAAGWGFQLSYYLPVHLVRGNLSTVFTAAPLQSRAWENNQFRTDNAFVLKAYYTFSGGKKVQRQNHYLR